MSYENGDKVGARNRPCDRLMLRVVYLHSMTINGKMTIEEQIRQCDSVADFALWHQLLNEMTALEKEYREKVLVLWTDYEYESNEWLSHFDFYEKQRQIEILQAKEVWLEWATQTSK